MTLADIQIREEALGALCRKWKIRRVELFGSALRGDMTPESDVDLLVEFEPDEGWSLMDLAKAQGEFSRLLNRRVDIVDRANLRRSANWIRREAILSSAEVIYGA